MRSEQVMLIKLDYGQGYRDAPDWLKKTWSQFPVEALRGHDWNPRGRGGWGLALSIEAALNQEGWPRGRAVCWFALFRFRAT